MFENSDWYDEEDDEDQVTFLKGLPAVYFTEIRTATRWTNLLLERVS